MELRALLADDEAVSPVIGVILMVAITVILAAVIGTFVLGLGDQVQDSAPNVNFEFDYDTAAEEVDITHDGGQDFDVDNVEVQPGSANTVTSFSSWSGTVSTGQTETIDYSGANSGETIRIVWNSPSGGSSQTIGASDIP